MEVRCNGDRLRFYLIGQWWTGACDTNGGATEGKYPSWWSSGASYRSTVTPQYRTGQCILVKQTIGVQSDVDDCCKYTGFFKRTWIR